MNMSKERPPIPFACDGAKIIMCYIDPRTKPSDYHPFPGSMDARMRGCNCLMQQWWFSGELRFATDCPVHEL